MGKLVWQPFMLEGYRYYYVLKAYRTRSGQIAFLRLITTLTPAKAMESYGYRYRIESLFRHLKSNGFDLESLHVQKDYKIQMMMATLVLAYTLAVVLGLQNYKRALALKKHGAPEMSLFRYGLDRWQKYLQSFALFLKQLLAFTKYWNKPKKPLLFNNVP